MLAVLLECSPFCFHPLLPQHDTSLISACVLEHDILIYMNVLMEEMYDNGGSGNYYHSFLFSVF